MFQPLDPTTYLDLARELASRRDTAARRTAADRAYYAAFLYSRDQLELKGYITPYQSTEDHKYVTENLRALIGSAGNDEYRLREARNDVTYKTGQLQDKLQWMINTADVIVQRVRALPPHRP
ncbi:MAG: hypothetical protein HY687_03255 [Chloroflexi bacterium]|nr:hypothetical protein [Chloroflexota bacterium]